MTYANISDAIAAAIGKIDRCLTKMAQNRCPSDYESGVRNGYDECEEIIRKHLDLVEPAPAIPAGDERISAECDAMVNAYWAGKTIRIVEPKPAPAFVEKGLEPPLSPFVGTDCPKCGGEFCGQINADGSWSDGTKLLCACGFKGWVNVHPEEGAYAGWDEDEPKPAPAAEAGLDEDILTFGAEVAEAERIKKRVAVALAKRHGELIQVTMTPHMDAFEAMAEAALLAARAPMRSLADDPAPTADAGDHRAWFVIQQADALKRQAYRDGEDGDMTDETLATHADLCQSIRELCATRPSLADDPAAFERARRAFWKADKCDLKTDDFVRAILEAAEAKP